MARRGAPDLAKLAAEARARHEEYANTERKRLGDVLNVPDGFVAWWMVPDELKRGRAEKLRREWSAKGAFAAPDGSGVVVNGVGNAEVWLVPNDVAASLQQARAARDAQERRRLGVR